MIYESIQKLIKYAERNGLITADDEYVVRNQLMEILQLSDWEENNADDRNASVSLCWSRSFPTPSKRD